MEKAKIFNLLSMAQKAGQVVSGEYAVKKMMQERKCYILLLASDIAAERKNDLEKIAGASELPLIYTVFTKEELGHCLGKALRSCILIVNKGFSEALRKYL